MAAALHSMLPSGPAAAAGARQAGPARGGRLCRTHRRRRRPDGAGASVGGEGPGHPAGQWQGRRSLPGTDVHIQAPPQRPCTNPHLAGELGSAPAGLLEEVRRGTPALLLPGTAAGLRGRPPRAPAGGASRSPLPLPLPARARAASEPSSSATGSSSDSEERCWQAVLSWLCSRPAPPWLLPRAALPGRLCTTTLPARLPATPAASADGTGDSCLLHPGPWRSQGCCSPRSRVMRLAGSGRSSAATRSRHSPLTPAGSGAYLFLAAARRMAGRVAPLKGTRPASDSYNITPRLHRSAGVASATAQQHATASG